MLTSIVSDVHQSQRSCCLTRRSLRILALWENNSFKCSSQHRSKQIQTSPLIHTSIECSSLSICTNICALCNLFINIFNCNVILMYETPGDPTPCLILMFACSPCSFLSPPVHIARWARMHRFLSVCLSVCLE